jgi:hypothetical protein
MPSQGEAVLLSGARHAGRKYELDAETPESRGIHRSGSRRRSRAVRVLAAVSLVHVGADLGPHPLDRLAGQLFLAAARRLCRDLQACLH